MSRQNGGGTGVRLRKAPIMGFRLWRRVHLVPGLRANISRSGISLSIGHRGAWYTVGPRGRRVTLGLPGTGIFSPTASRPPPLSMPASPRRRGPASIGSRDPASAADPWRPSGGVRRRRRRDRVASPVAGPTADGRRYRPHARGRARTPRRLGGLLHDDEARSLQVLHKPLGDDPRHHLGRVVLPLPAVEAQREREHNIGVRAKFRTDVMA